MHVGLLYTRLPNFTLWYWMGYAGTCTKLILVLSCAISYGLSHLKDWPALINPRSLPYNWDGLRRLLLLLLLYPMFTCARVPGGSARGASTHGVWEVGNASSRRFVMVTNYDFSGASMYIDSVLPISTSSFTHSFHLRDGRLVLILYE